MVDALVATPVVPHDVDVDVDVLVQLVRRAGQLVRATPSSAPIAGELSLVHPGDPSCGVMTGHPVWLHAVVKTAELRTIRP